MTIKILKISKRKHHQKQQLNLKIKQLTLLKKKVEQNLLNKNNKKSSKILSHLKKKLKLMKKR